jgi:hypothetical protein
MELVVGYTAAEHRLVPGSSGLTARSSALRGRNRLARVLDDVHDLAGGETTASCPRGTGDQREHHPRGEVPEGDQTDGRERHPDHGGDRLGGVDVVFEVASQPYPLDERAATLMAERLRVKAAHEPGAEGVVGARTVADAIELRLIEDTADPVTLGGDGAEAVFHALNVPTGGDRQQALYDAVKRLHDERLRPKS